MNVRTASAPATGPQISFLVSLLDQRVVDEDFAQRVQDKIDNGILSKGQASDAIGFVKAQAYKPKDVAAPAAQVEVGIYEVDGTVYQVKANRSKTANYALVLVGTTYEYSPGTIKKLTAENRITVDRAIELSGLIGQCIRCSRVLTAEKSVRQAIGPVCITKF